jgi:GTPase SAR1 family protein
MGCVSSKAATDAAKDEEYKRSKEIDAQNAKDLEADSKVCKLLLLGAGESGKSTLFKQIMTIYGDQMTEKQREQYISLIHQLVITSAKTLVTQSEVLGHDLLPANQKSKGVVLGLADDSTHLDAECADHISKIWADPGIKQTFAKKSTFQLVDTADYFLDKVKNIAEDSYVPSYADVLRCRVRTTGIVENRFEISNHKFLLVDVGGQRNERKKWIHCFEGVTAVIFVASLSEFDQCLFEDNKTSRVVESLNLFAEVLGMKWFTNCPIIFFLNKKDIFAEKLTRVSLKQFLPDYTGDNSFQSGVDFIQTKFMEKAQDPKRKQMIYPHVTCATDTDNVHTVFEDVKEILIQRALAHSGLEL